MTETILNGLTGILRTAWSTPQLRRVATVINGGTPTSDEDNWDGDVPFITPPDLRRFLGGIVTATERSLTELGAQSGSTLVDAGVVVSNRAPIGYVSRLGQRSAFNQGCKVLVPRHIDERFLTYTLTASRPLLEKLGQGTTFMELSSANLAALRVPSPPLSEQRAIADYLDRETALIDSLIEKQEALIDRLRNRRTAVIMQAVTLGVDRGGLCDSGIFWAPKMPSHWYTKPLKRVLTSVQTGVWGEEAEGGPGELMCVRVADFDRRRLTVGEVPTIRKVRRAERRKCGLTRGDLLIEKSGGTAINPVGFVVSYDSDEAAVCANFIARLRVAESQMSRYWLYVLHGSYASGLTWRSVKQTTGIQNLDLGSFLSEIFPVPPASEQARIVNHLDQETTMIDGLIAKTERFISLTKERRSALITAAVTSQIDVSQETAA